MLHVNGIHLTVTAGGGGRQLHALPQKNQYSDVPMQNMHDVTTGHDALCH